MMIGGTTTCIPRCSDNEYLVQNTQGVYTCQPCHPDCDGCAGPSQNDCINCRQFYVIVDGQRSCRSSCGGNSFAAADGECFECDPSCLGCTGTTNTDCVLCSSTSELVGSMCLTSCPSGQVFDTNTNSCIADP